MTTRFEEIAHKVEAGIRLSEDDAVYLFEYPDLVAIGKLADLANLRKNGPTAFYNVNRHINPTNICAQSCKFCAFSRKPGEEGAYAYEIDEILEKAQQASDQGATEVHMVGGLHPRWQFKKYIEIISAVREKFPHLHIKAFTAVELDWMAKKDRRTIAEILKDLVDAGLSSLPGGGAEIFHPEVREKICDTKVTGEEWINTHRMAHKMGLRSNCTMLYGHIEKFKHRVDHMKRLRDLQDETGGFNVFIPLAFQPFENEMGIDRYTFGYDDLKTLAVARLFLDNFRHIKAYWIMLGQDIAQLALQFGANDIDGTVTEEKISRMAGGRAGVVMSRGDIENLIQKAGRRPIERDTLYRPIRQEDETKASEIEEGIKLHKEEDSLHQMAARACQIRDSFHLPKTATLLPSITLKLADFGTDIEAIMDNLDVRIKKIYTETDAAPQALVLDLTDITVKNPKFSLDYLMTLTERLLDAFTELEIILKGFVALAEICEREELSVPQLYELLNRAGIEVIASSFDEDESKIAPEDLFSLHRFAHENDILTIGKVTIASDLSRPNPDWEKFSTDLEVFAELQSLGKGLSGVYVIPALGSTLTSNEYLEAVSFARIALDRVKNIIVPLQRIPTMSPLKAVHHDQKQHAAQKIAPLAMHFGANDLGEADVEELHLGYIFEDILSAGFMPKIRSSKFYMLDDQDAVIKAQEKLRHFPERHA